MNRGAAGCSLSSADDQHNEQSDKDCDKDCDQGTGADSRSHRLSSHKSAESRRVGRDSITWLPPRWGRGGDWLLMVRGPNRRGYCPSALGATKKSKGTPIGKAQGWTLGSAHTSPGVRIVTPARSGCNSGGSHDRYPHCFSEGPAGDTRVVPSGLNATLDAVPVWPVSGASSCR